MQNERVFPLRKASGCENWPKIWDIKCYRASDQWKQPHLADNDSRGTKADHFYKRNRTIAQPPQSKRKTASSHLHCSEIIAQFHFLQREQEGRLGGKKRQRAFLAFLCTNKRSGHSTITETVTTMNFGWESLCASQWCGGWEKRRKLHVSVPFELLNGKCKSFPAVSSVKMWFFHGWWQFWVNFALNSFQWWSAT